MALDWPRKLSCPFSCSLALIYLDEKIAKEARTLYHRIGVFIEKESAMNSLDKVKEEG